MTRKLRVAVVGLGVGKGHLESYAKIPDHFEVKAVCDLDAAKAKAVAEQFGIARHTTQLSELLASNELDIIDICTPPNTHRALIEQVLAAGLHVICEKPLVGSLTDADAIAAAQIAGTWDTLTNWNPTNDPTVKPMPTGSYNAELVTPLSPAMRKTLQNIETPKR